MNATDSKKEELLLMRRKFPHFRSVAVRKDSDGSYLEVGLDDGAEEEEKDAIEGLVKGHSVRFIRVGEVHFERKSWLNRLFGSRSNDSQIRR